MNWGWSDRINAGPHRRRMGMPNQDLLPVNPLSKIPTLVLPDGSAMLRLPRPSASTSTLAGGGRPRAAGGARALGGSDAARARQRAARPADALRNERDKPEARSTQEWLSSFAAKLEATLAGWSGCADPWRMPFGIGQIAMGCALSYLDFRLPISTGAQAPNLAAWHVDLLRPPVGPSHGGRR
jgi:glutathione S-transferase